MKRTFLCGLICLLSFLLPIPPAMAQNTFSVRLNNRSYDPTYVSVYDHICQIWVYQGQIVNQGMRAITVCPDRYGKGTVTVYDRRRQSATFRNVGRGESISIRFDSSLSRGN